MEEQKISLPASKMDLESGYDGEEEDEKKYTVGKYLRKMK